MHTETKVAGQVGLHGLMAQFNTPEALLAAGAGRRATKAIATWTPTLRCQWKDWRRPLGSTAKPSPILFLQAALPARAEDSD